MSTTESTSPASSTATPAKVAVARNVRRKKKTEGRKKRVLKLKTDKEFAKKYFEARSKRAVEKKSAFRKQKTKKK